MYFAGTEFSETQISKQFLSIDWCRTASYMEINGAKEKILEIKPLLITHRLMNILIDSHEEFPLHVIFHFFELPSFQLFIILLLSLFI